jgi:hypothetical protein
MPLIIDRITITATVTQDIKTVFSPRSIYASITPTKDGTSGNEHSSLCHLQSLSEYDNKNMMKIVNGEI